MTPKADLTRNERLILWNQFAILEVLKPEDAEHYKKLMKILEYGYRFDYHDLWPHIGEETFSEDAAKEVIDILAMYAAVQDSAKQIGSIDGIEEWMLKFPGFDGNYESTYYGYLGFLVEKQEKFQYVDRSGDGYNSHAPLLGRYRAMLHRYEELGSPNLMSAKDVQYVLTAIATDSFAKPKL